MNVLFDYGDVLEVIKNEVSPFLEGATTAQSSAHKQETVKYFKLLYLIHRCVDVDNLEKVGGCTSSKKSWKVS